MTEHVDRLPHVPGDVLAAGRVVRRAGYTIVKRDAYRELRQRIEAAEATIERVKAVRDGWYGKPFMSDNADELDVALDAPHSPAEPVSPVSTPTETHGETGEAQEGPAPLCGVCREPVDEGEHDWCDAEMRAVGRAEGDCQ